MDATSVKEKPTQEELKRQLHYDPDTGLFTWLVSNSRRVKVGDVAGCLNKVTLYEHIGINGTLCMAHRLAWLYMKGYWPEHEIDHKNGIRDDNRWINLRHVTRSCNFQNQTVYKNNKSGFYRVSLVKRDQKWDSRIMINGKINILGSYEDPLDAALARFTAEDQCPEWTCNYRSELVKAIKRAWPEFNQKGMIF
jgi:hypothetical protein